MDNKILIVDDEEDVRDMLHLALSSMGYDVLDAEDGTKALQIFRDARPRIVLTDIKMPRMDGIELLKELKREDPDTEVIMITGHGDMDLAIKSIKHEATDFVPKPINLEVLKIALRRAQDKALTRQQIREYTENLEELVREKTELQNHLSSLGLMISSISHSIKGLLTGLDGGMYKLDAGVTRNDRERIEEGLEVVKITVERIRKMILNIIYYAKERDLQWNQVDLLSFADEVSKVMESKMQSHNIEFVKDFDPNLGKCELDDEHLHSALVNILENAVDACTKDQSKKGHRIVFNAKQDKNDVIFEIHDNGIGMDSTTLDKLFTPFFSSKGDKGTGLGLFISNKVVEQHGGQINVKSAPAQGSQFSLRIPKIPPESPKDKTTDEE
ncbi:MAG: hybrid sensor histidine kinase/response regulator [Deltaproteobacteria bacterium]|nr:hybrid sensor histidine kinase/response regulator [Deltaproteobacteria bacterium]